MPPKNIQYSDGSSWVNGKFYPAPQDKINTVAENLPVELDLSDVLGKCSKE